MVHRFLFLCRSVITHLHQGCKTCNRAAEAEGLGYPTKYHISAKSHIVPVMAKLRQYNVDCSTHAMGLTM